MGSQESGKRYTAAEVMAGLKGEKKRVTAVGLPDRESTDPEEVKKMKRPFANRQELRDELIKEFLGNFDLDACAVVHDQSGRVMRGSVMVAAVMPTTEETDANLL